MKKIILLLIIIIRPAFSQNINNWVWAKLYGGNYADGSNSITTDGTHIYQTGYWVSDINFGNGYNFGIYVTGNNFFLHKTDNMGNTHWARVIISDNATVGSVVHADKNNHLIVGGTTMGSTILSNPYTLNNPFPGKRMIFLLQYDTSGNLLWSKRIVSPNHQDITNIKTDDNNNIYVAGQFQGKYLVYANDTLFNTDTSGISTDAFLIKLDNAGNYLWGKTWNVNNNTNLNEYSKGLDIDGNHLYWAVYNTNLAQTQIVRISNNGSVKWKKDLLNTTHQANIIACQKNKHRLVITGNPTSYSSIVDNYLLDKPFVIILDTNKNIVVVDVLTNSNVLPSAFQSQSVYTNSNDDIILTGTFTNSVTIKGLTISGGNNSAWIAQANDNFNFIYWAANISNSYGSKINSVCTDNTGQIYVTGTTGTGTSIAFGNLLLTKANPTDILTAKIDGMVSVPHQSYLSQTLQVFPNPSDGTFFIQSEYPTKIVISNVLGQIIKEESIYPHTYHAFRLSVPSGVYFLQDTYTNQKIKILVNY